MDFPIQTDTLPISRGHGSEFQYYDVFISLKIVFIITNRADPDEMPHFGNFGCTGQCILVNPSPIIYKKYQLLNHLVTVLC